MKTALLLIVLGWFLWVVLDWWVRRPPADRHKRTRVERRQIMVRIGKAMACVLGFLCSLWFAGGWVASWFYTKTPEVISYTMLCGGGYVWYLIYCWRRER